MKWPVFSEKEVIVGNPISCIGVCTLWSPRKNFVEKYLWQLMGQISIVGNLYSVFGIGIMIRNFLANPELRYLLVTGTELGFAKEVLKNMRNERNDPNLTKKLFLDSDQLARFLKQVRMIYVDAGEIQTLVDSGEYRDFCLEQQKFEPIIVPLPKPEAKNFPTAGSSHLIRARTVAEAYEGLLREIRLFGHITGGDSEGHKRQELWELNMVISEQNPFDFVSIPHPEYGEEEIKQYCEDFWDGIKRGDTAYAYGHIIRFAFGDQVEAAIKAFKKKPDETFRVVISLWDPRVDEGSINAEDPPCIVMLQLRIINDRLYQWGYIRTNDMFNGWPLNAIALRYFQYKFLERLQSELKRPELQLGDLAITSGSAHIYERDWLKIDEFLKDALPKKFFNDPKGNFEIKIEDRKIIVNHFSPEGGLLQTFQGTNALKLSKELEPFISQIKNALYVGRSLQEMQDKLSLTLDDLLSMHF
ncbi:hypothetical protein HZB04_02850 [Candidatus Wolfebacteria bacterium]|nr:hypothetical protein [Candidatus Wolfebacteria bacterium]